MRLVSWRRRRDMDLNRSIQSPVVVVCATAFIVLATFLATGYFRAKAVDPRVTLEYSGGPARGQTPAGQTGIATTPDGEGARTAGRIGAATAPALSAGGPFPTQHPHPRTPPHAHPPLSPA